MRIVRYPTRDTWEELVKRPQMNTTQLTQVVTSVLDDVRQNGDAAAPRHSTPR